MRSRYMFTSKRPLLSKQEKAEIEVVIEIMEEWVAVQEKGRRTWQASYPTTQTHQTCTALITSTPHAAHAGLAGRPCTLAV